MKIKKVFILMFLVCVPLLAGCQKKTSELEKREPEPKERTENINLKTYTNSQLGLQFKHPEETTVYDCSYTIKLSYQQYLDSICQEGPKETIPPIDILQLAGDLESSMKWQENQLDIVSKEDTTVAGKPAVRMVGTWISGGMRPELKDTKCEVVFVDAGAKAYSVDLSYLDVEKEGESQEKYKTAFDQIVESLEFTN